MTRLETISISKENFFNSTVKSMVNEDIQSVLSNKVINKDTVMDIKLELVDLIYDREETIGSSKYLELYEEGINSFINSILNKIEKEEKDDMNLDFTLSYLEKDINKCETRLSNYVFCSYSKELNLDEYLEMFSKEELKFTPYYDEEGRLSLINLVANGSDLGHFSTIQPLEIDLQIFEDYLSIENSALIDIEYIESNNNQDLFTIENERNIKLIPRSVNEMTIENFTSFNDFYYYNKNN